VFVGFMGFSKTKHVFPFFLQIHWVCRDTCVLGLDAGLFRGQVHIGDGGHQGDKTVRGSAVDRPPDQRHPLFHTACRQARLCIMIPALFNGHTELGQALHSSRGREKPLLGPFSENKHRERQTRGSTQPTSPNTVTGPLAGVRGKCRHPVSTGLPPQPKERFTKNLNKGRGGPSQGRCRYLPCSSDIQIKSYTKMQCVAVQSQW
jgi:hypothetical protein